MTVQTKRRNRQFLRVLLGAVLVATCVKVWFGPVTAMPTAQAQIPNAGNQRLQLVNEVRKSNELLAQIALILKSQTLKVEVQGTDKTNVGRPRTPMGPRP
ncbi:MAG TPA: hypothetical protein PKN33_05480 [Phycisphaerae bacterium]|nr:hypothetical protein [Phycisphaerales bacterium]HNO77494.1 hypothetical protein [Phycisphaerae bacterium]